MLGRSYYVAMSFWPPFFVARPTELAYRAEPNPSPYKEFCI